MKCPKCQYISFDTGDRCRNCGYEFSLTVVDQPRPDLRIQTGNEALGPLGDFALEVDRTPSWTSPPNVAGADGISVPAPRPITSSFDLPLFKERRTEEGAPRVAPTATPRPPLSVRRSTPPAPRMPSRAANEPVLDLGGPVQVRTVVPSSAAAAPVADDAFTDVAPVLARLLAAGVDGFILATIAVIVLYLTLKICGLPLARAAAIPVIPFASFLLLVAGGYFTLFTAAGGQTVGKMATGIRVVPMDEDLHHSRVPLGVSILRAAAYLVSALPAGAGFLPALAGADRRTIHDRLADTRVVKA
jgi:uncharacterized RDD family membrane protein YckC